jgi:hypothetical protein
MTARILSPPSHKSTELQQLPCPAALPCATFTKVTSGNEHIPAPAWRSCNDIPRNDIPRNDIPRNDIPRKRHSAQR